MPRPIEARTSVPVKDVMSSPVITVTEDDDLETVAKQMSEKDLGSIIVIDPQNNPIGIITERDVVVRVTAKNLTPRDVKAKEVMSKPLKIIGPDADITEAAGEMSRHGIRRLVVMDKGKMTGIISSKDIVGITPALIDIIMERARITETPLLPVGAEVAGACDRCLQWSDSLRQVEGRFLCDECRIELHLEEKEE